MKLTNLISRRPLQALTLGLALLGLQSCEYIKPVFVPKADKGAPLAVGTLYDPKTGDFYGGEGDTFYTDDLNEPFYFIVSGFDSGGAKRLVWWSECEVNGAISTSPLQFVKWQPGTFGDVVDNGLWELSVFQASQFNFGDTPPAGESGMSAKCRMGVEIMDFHGNVSTAYTPTIVYEE
ncbi:MAG: hypothetical protein ACYTFV_05070 [Planctomycetota bacterium]|jgi:hypothetical protein